MRLSLDRARAVWIAAQGLGGTGALVPTLERTGFLRTLGGVEAYLAARARMKGLKAKDLDAACQRSEVQVIPAVRGCMYLVARSQVPLALRIAGMLNRTRDERDHAKAGIRPGEIDKLGTHILATLKKKGALTTDALRKALPDGALGSLGEQGKKAGLSSPLPPALRALELRGQVERVTETGRLDTERYLWRATAKSPFDGAKLPDDPGELHARLAKLFFTAAGLGSLRDFAEWAGIGVRDAVAAGAKLGLVPVAVEGIDEELHVLDSARASLDKADAPDTVALLPFEDNLTALHGGPTWLVDRQHHDLPMPSWGMGARVPTLGDSRHMMARPVVADGKVVGIWEYEPDEKRAVVATFAPVSAATRKRIDAAAEETAAFLTRDLGHGRSFSLDTDEALRERAAFIRKLKRSAR
jgi:hypothetical protein